MNVDERVLSVLGCRYVNDVVINSPYEITSEFISALGIKEVILPIYASDHSCNNFPCDNATSYYSNNTERYKHAKRLCMYTEIVSSSPFRISSVIQRIKNNQEVFQAKFERKMLAEREYNTAVTATTRS